MLASGILLTVASTAKHSLSFHSTTEMLKELTKQTAESLLTFYTGLYIFY